MVRNLTFLFLIMFIGCEMNSKQVIKPEKFIFEEVRFDSVTKKLIFNNFKKDSDIDNMKKIINYWFDNKIKTNGFEGSLDVNVNNIDIHKLKNLDYFKVSIKLVFEFIEIKENQKSKKTYNVEASEYGEIEGSFSINDQENLTLNLMHQALNSVSKKLSDLN
tara:strand:+ start:720 stop:1205 length:486 start_codon:yes stop_codon:yes gene_type:complete